MRQLLYVSSAMKPMSDHELAQLLVSSRRNNPRVGVTGLLWTDGTRFLQVLEGEHDAVGDTLKHISADPRHRAIVVLHDRAIAERSFGSWAMALMDDGDAQLTAALQNASAEVRGSFEGLAAARRAA